MTGASPPGAGWNFRPGRGRKKFTVFLRRIRPPDCCRFFNFFRLFFIFLAVTKEKGPLLLKFIKYGTSYHHQNLKGYLLMIARNLCFDYFRDKKVTETSVGWEELDKIPKLGNQIKEKEDIIYLQNLLKALSPDIREVVVLRMYEEMKFKDIAGMMGCSVSTAKSRFRLGISQLKRMMEECDDGR